MSEPLIIESIRQSDVASYSRCPREYMLDRTLSGEGGDTLSATVFGTVIHHCVQVLQRLFLEGRADALEVALRTFEHYWHPDNIGNLPGASPVTVWLPRQTWGGLRERGMGGLKDCYAWMQVDEGQLLALEVGFDVPLDLGSLGEFRAKGTLDRLCIRMQKAPRRMPFLSVDDNKTGRKPTHLRYAFQWTMYCWATTQPAFWESTWEPEELDKVKRAVHKFGVALYVNDGTNFPLMPRRGRWLSFASNTFEEHDCGWRTELDFGRMRLGLAEFVEANQKGVFPLNISGSTCPFCPYARNGACGGLVLAEVSDDDRYPTLDITREG